MVEHGDVGLHRPRVHAGLECLMVGSSLHTNAGRAWNGSTPKQRSTV